MDSSERNGRVLKTFKIKNAHVVEKFGDAKGRLEFLIVTTKNEEGQYRTELIKACEIMDCNLGCEQGCEQTTLVSARKQPDKEV